MSDVEHPAETNVATSNSRTRQSRPRTLGGQRKLVILGQKSTVWLSSRFTGALSSFFCGFVKAASVYGGFERVFVLWFLR